MKKEPPRFHSVLLYFWFSVDSRLKKGFLFYNSETMKKGKRAERRREKIHFAAAAFPFAAVVPAAAPFPPVAAW